MSRKHVVAGVMSMIMAATILLPATVEPVSAAAATTSSNIFQPTSLEKVNLTSSSYLQVDNVQFYYVKGDKYVYYTVTVHNNDTSSLNLMDYWFNIKSTSGEKYTISTLGLDDKKDNLISAKSSKTFKIYTKVNAALDYSNLLLNVIKWDFSVSGYERNIGTVKISKSYSNVTPVGNVRQISDSSTSILTQASALQLVEVGDETEALLSVYFTNNSGSSVTLDDYIYYLRTASNSHYALESEVSSITLLPGEKKKINFYAKLPENMSYKTYQLFIAQETGTDTNLEVPVAYYALMNRSAENSITAAGESGSITIDGQAITAEVKNTMVDSNTEYHNITTSLVLTNASKSPVALPTYQYMLMTSTNEQYPLETTSTEETLLSGVSKEVVMTTSIPADLSLSDLKLIVKKTATDNQQNDYLIAQFQIPESQPITTNSKATYVNSQGAYEVTVDNFERLPWDSQDIVNATITVKNIGTETQAMPQLAATAWFNGVKISSEAINMLQVQESLGLKPGETSTLILTTKISSDAEFDTAKIQLSETIDSTAVSTVGNFIISAEDAVLPTYMAGSTSYYTLEQPGVKANLSMLESNTYVADSNNVVESLLSYRNIGSRYAKLPTLVAYYVTESGSYIPATVTNVDTELGTDGSSLISITANVPSRYEAKDLKLFIGQGIADGNYISGEATADSYVNAAILGLVNEDTEVKSLFEKVSLRPYTFNINKINAKTDNSSQVVFDFNYDLTEYKPFDLILNSHNLVFEIVYNGNSYEKVYQLGTGNEALTVNTEVQASFTINDTAMAGVANGGFTLNVYDEVNGARKLLITHKVLSFGS